MQSDPNTNPPLNPRTTRVRTIVLGAATALLVKEGHQAVTPQRVSKETGVARSTIYRHWPDRPSLLLDAIDTVVAPHHTASTVGDLGIDLKTALDNLRSRIGHQPFLEVFAALLDQATQSADLAKAQRRFVSGVTTPVREVIVTAIESGQVDPTVKPDEAVALLTGPLFHEHVLQRDPISDDLIARTIEGFLTTSANRR